MASCSLLEISLEKTMKALGFARRRCLAAMLVPLALSATPARADLKGPFIFARNGATVALTGYLAIPRGRCSWECLASSCALARFRPDRPRRLADLAPIAEWRPQVWTPGRLGVQRCIDRYRKCLTFGFPSWKACRVDMGLVSCG